MAIIMAHKTEISRDFERNRNTIDFEFEFECECECSESIIELSGTEDKQNTQSYAKV